MGPGSGEGEGDGCVIDAMDGKRAPESLSGTASLNSSQPPLPVQDAVRVGRCLRSRDPTALCAGSIADDASM